MTYSVRAPARRSSWSIGSFADLAGVTVKALHHYERRGLLAPMRTRAGYRRYSIHDLARLERILALRKLGLPLKQISPLLGSARQKPRAPDVRKEHCSGVAGALEAHRDALVEKQRLLGEAIAAIDAVARAGDPHSALERFVGESSWNRWEARRAQTASPAPRAPDRASPSRVALFHEIRDALDRDQSGEAAAALAARWHALVEAEAEGNPDTIAALRKISATRGQWPDGARRYVASLYNADVDTWERVMDVISRSTPSTLS